VEKNLKPSWFDHFKISKMTWTALCEEAQRQGIHPAAAAIELGLISDLQLLHYESEQHALARLKDSFFVESAVPVELWKEHDHNREIYRKNATLPIAQWNGRTIWAKLSAESFDGEKLDSASISVLAPWNRLKKWFIAWAEANTSVEQASAAGFEIEVEPPSFLDFSAVSLIKDDGNEPTVLSQTPVKSTPAPQPTPLRPLNAPTPPPLPTIAATPAPTATLSSTPNPAPNPASVSAPTPPPIPISLELWAPFFDRLAILLTQNGRMSLRYWQGMWSQRLRHGDSVTIDAPSVLKIVVDSGHPFHGRPSPSPANEKIFQWLCDGQYPEHLTIVPVFLAKELIAVVVGTCAPQRAANIKLAHLEQLSRQLADQLKVQKSAG
jgi:hypothetical protein